MAETEVVEAEGVSLFELATALVRARLIIAALAFVGAFLTASFVLLKAPMFKSYTSFFSQQTDVGRSGLASLAGQFGVALNSSPSSISPEFYSRLARSPVVLRYVARDSFIVAEMGGEKRAFMDLFKIPPGSQEQREELAVKRLLGMVSTQVIKTTGVVEVSALTKWPSVSHGIVVSVLEGISDFNRTTKQGQATEERRFIEGRRKVAEAELRDAEDRLERFIRTNRSYSASPELSFEASRLQRLVGLRQAVYNALEQSYDDVRIREVRDTPAITIIEEPKIPAGREPRKTIQRTFLGGVAGLSLGIVLTLLVRGLAVARRTGGTDVAEFFDALGELEAKLPRMPWRKGPAAAS